MKHFILAFLLSFSLNSYSQNFENCISGTFGIVNSKIRVQYETPLNKKSSLGINMNYYLVNWKGLVFEPFIRIYNEKNGCNEGFFGQFKLIYGNLKTLDFEYYQNVISNRRWSTFGAGIAGGYKFLINKKFVIEPIAGFRFLSPPVYRYIDGDYVNTGAAIGEGVGWYLTTGLPIDFQLKFGYQF